MKSPLAVDKETIKKYKITEEFISPVQKLSYLQEQLGQIMAMHWRARVDVIHAERLKDSDNPIIRDKGLQNSGTHYNEVEQSLGAILMIRKMIEELRAEYPELQVEE